MKREARYLIVAPSLHGSLLSEALHREDESCVVDEFSSVQEAIQQLAAHRYRCVFIYIRDHLNDLLKLKVALVGGEDSAPIAGIADDEYEYAALQLMKSGVIDRIVKPIDGTRYNIEALLRELAHRDESVPTDSHQFLIVDDDKIDRRALQRALSKTRFAVTCDEVSSAEEGLLALQKTHYKCVFLDYNLPGWNGLQFIEAVWQTGNDAPIIILVSGRSNERVAADAVHKGASAYVSKADVSPEHLERQLEAALQQRHGEKVVLDYVRKLERVADRTTLAQQL